MKLLSLVSFFVVSVGFAALPVPGSIAVTRVTGEAAVSLAQTLCRDRRTQTVRGDSLRTFSSYHLVLRTQDGLKQTACTVGTNTLTHQSSTSCAISTSTDGKALPPFFAPIRMG